VLGFISDNPRQDDEFRKLRVELRRSELKPRHRKGYYTLADVEVE
jgi:hypothetical protein